VEAGRPYCGGLKLGVPRVSVAVLCALHELLIACESRFISGDDNIVAQEAQDGSAVGAVRRLAGIAGGVVSGVSTSNHPAEGPGWRPRDDQRYHEA
jgi:hypothetical protein